MGLQGVSRRARGGHLRGVKQTAQRQIHIAVASQIVRFGHVQRLREGDQHPLVRLPIGEVSNGQGDGGGRDAGSAAAQDHGGESIHFGEEYAAAGAGFKLGDAALQPHHIAQGHVHAKAIVVNKDAFRGGRAAIGIGIFFLQVEAAQFIYGVLVIPYNHTFDDDIGHAVERAAAATALDGADERGAVAAAAKAAGDGAKAEAVVASHVVDCAVLITDLVGKNGDSAGFAGDEVTGWIEGVALRAAGSNGRNRPTRRTAQIHPTTAQGHRLVKVDGEVGIQGHIRRTVYRGGAHNRWRAIAAVGGVAAQSGEGVLGEANPLNGWIKSVGFVAVAAANGVQTLDGVILG